MPSTEKPVEQALFERVRELTCLYSIASLASETERSVDETLQRIAELLPSGCKYPEIASAKITVEGRTFASPGFRLTPDRLAADIAIGHEICGDVLIVYSEPRPKADEGPFLSEERRLLETVASRLSLIVERDRAERDRAKFTEQLHHADRLATIGQLAAGVAHELNEPLAGILGLAQLSAKTPGLPEPVARDLGKIVQETLHAREIIRNLLLFARRMPPVRKPVCMNELLEEALALTDARRHAGTEIVRLFQADLPNFMADPSQIRQVLVNLLVNAEQAMPTGGRLEVETRLEDGHVVAAIADTGVGMTEDTRSRLFAPFFTTKDVGEGTGLGLAVASGIVHSHGGTIRVESKIGRGSRFEVRLPLTPTRSADAPSDAVVEP